jgi:hypothetical protein
MSPAEFDELRLESLMRAHRDLDPEGLPVPPSEWFDLSPEDCDELFRRQSRARAIESAMHERGWNSTVTAVLSRI